MLNGVMRGVKVLLVRLAPDSIQHSWHELQAQAAHQRVVRHFRRTKEIWASMPKRHRSGRRGERTFRTIFAASSSRSTGNSPRAGA